MKSKVEFYLKEKIKVHIETKSNSFYNGLILECADEHLILIDRYLGRVYIYFFEITKFERFKEAKG